MVAFVGLGNSVVDLWLQLRGWLYKPVPRRSRSLAAAAAADGAGGARSSPTGPRCSTTAPPTRRRPRSSPSGPPRGLAGGRADGAVAPRARSVAAGAAVARRTVPALPRLGLVRGVHASSPSSSRSSTSTSARTVGYEALTRFADGQSPARSASPTPQAAGIGVELDAALVARRRSPPPPTLPPGAWVSINVSPGARRHGRACSPRCSPSAPCPVVIEYSRRRRHRSRPSGSPRCPAT